MRGLQLAAVVAGLALSAQAASAAVITIAPHGPDNAMDAFIDINRYPGDFSVTVKFDESAFSELHVTLFGDAALYIKVDCNNPQNTNCYYADPQLEYGVTIDPNAAGSRAVYNKISPEFTWTPVDGGGFTLNSYKTESCLPLPDEKVCHEIYRVRQIIIAGYLTSGEPVDFDVAYGAAAPLAVPEPATWAMMIAGFGMAGAALRRRRVVEA